MSFTLALDTSLGSLHLALQTPDGTVLTHTNTQPRAADTLHTTLQTLLNEHQLNLSNLTHFITTIGPGSFTGIRMGLAVGHALKLTNPNLQLIALGTLEALASNFLTTDNRQPTTSFHIATDAAGSTAYLQTFTPDSTPQTEPQCLPTAELPTENLYTPATFLVPNTHQPIILKPFNPITLLTLAQNPTHHKPFQPTYVKPLNYKPQA